jgi:UDP-N-acetylglucosamine 1-carboxyvinyltransferase
MATFRIQGGAQLSGEIEPQGAKNEALQIICAVLLTGEPVIINNIPDIRDVNKLIDLLASMGVAVEKLGEARYRFQANNVNADYLETEEYKIKAAGLRGSIMILGPLLASPYLVSRKPT